ncbi:MAG: type IV pilus inner membrane component PilO [Gaiellaceae bacterium]
MSRLRSLPQPVLLALPVAAGAVVLVLGMLVLVSPQGGKAAALRAQAAAVQQQAADEIAQAAAARSATGAPRIKVADVYKLVKAMPSTADIPDVLLQLNQLAEQSGVSLESIAPGAASPLGAYSSLPLSLSAQGDFYSVTDFLYRLRNLVSVRAGALAATGRIYTIGSVSLSPSGKLVTASIALQTYVYGGTTTAVTAAPTGTTATTTTTTPGASGPSAAGAP